MREVVIAIDGPAASGKSTVARQVAHQLGFRYIDTGAMYRAFTWKVLRQRVDLSDEEALTVLAEACKIRFVFPRGKKTASPPRIFVNGEDVTEEIRTPRVSGAVSDVSAAPGVRRVMISKQRALARGNVVVEGRDIGTAVFPQADVKVFLVATPCERAKRRQLELSNKGHKVDVVSVQREILARDQIDSTRPTSPLLRASDATVIDTTSKTVEEVVKEVVQLAKATR